MQRVIKFWKKESWSLWFIYFQHDFSVSFIGDFYFFILSISKQKRKMKNKSQLLSFNFGSLFFLFSFCLSFFFYFFLDKNTSREVNCCVITPFHTTHSWLVIVLVLDTCCNALDDLEGDDVDVLTSEFFIILLAAQKSLQKISNEYKIWNYVALLNIFIS